MTTLLWLVIAALLGGIGYLAWRAVDKARERERTEEARFAAFIQAGKPTPAPAPAPAAAPPPPPNQSTLHLEKLLFEAASKAAAAGEPALAAQLYGRLLERFPDSHFAEQARAAIKTPGKAGRG